MTPTSPASPQPPPTVFAWAGGAEAFARLTQIFYGHVKTDPILAPVFAKMSPEHPEWVAQWLGEVFGGPAPTPKSAEGIRHAEAASGSGPDRQPGALVQLMGRPQRAECGRPRVRSAFVAYLGGGPALCQRRLSRAPDGMPVPRGNGPGGPPGRRWLDPTPSLLWNRRRR